MKTQKPIKCYRFVTEDMKSEKRLRKARKSQRSVVCFLEDRGFIVSEVNHPYSNGKDIVAIKDNFNCSIEVKSVIRGNRCLIVKKPNLLCDYIAVVMPNKMIHFESVSDWMKMCNRKSGVRNVTSLFRFYSKMGLGRKNHIHKIKGSNLRCHN